MTLTGKGLMSREIKGLTMCLSVMYVFTNLSQIPPCVQSCVLNVSTEFWVVNVHGQSRQ